ncbi:MAG: DNA polymerase III subunit delta' [Deltaproteobacteria bacterium]|nr:DNA polymerase III subunit delta' [Deltaproteobacteria bacterium]
MPSLVGQEAVTTALQNATQRGRLGHGLLFMGSHGVGRETAARLLAAGLLCIDEEYENHLPFGCGHCNVCRRVASGNHPDVHWLMSSAESQKRGLTSSVEKVSVDLKVDQIRELVREMRMRPFEGRARVAIVVDAHRMNDNAANAFLKTLEEPGESSMIILLVPHIRSVLPTIASRCQRVLFQPLDEQSIVHILQAKGIERAEERAAKAEGSVARAVEIDLDERQGREAQVEELFEELLTSSTGERLDAIERLGRDRIEVDALLSIWEDNLARALRLHSRGEAVAFPASLHSRNAMVTLEAMRETRTAISRNAHVQLALEELFLKNLSPKVLGL